MFVLKKMFNRSTGTMHYALGQNTRVTLCSRTGIRPAEDNTKHRMVCGICGAAARKMLRFWSRKGTSAR